MKNEEARFINSVSMEGNIVNFQYNLPTEFYSQIVVRTYLLFYFRLFKKPKMCYDKM